MSGIQRSQASTCVEFQAFKAPDGFILHVAGPVEGRHHHWTLRIRMGLERTFLYVLQIYGTRFSIYGDSGYSRRWFLEVPFQGATLTAEQGAFNTEMVETRITVEWFFKEIKMYFATVDFKRRFICVCLRSVCFTQLPFLCVTSETTSFLTKLRSTLVANHLVLRIM